MPNQPEPGLTPSSSVHKNLKQGAFSIFLEQEFTHKEQETPGLSEFSTNLADSVKREDRILAIALTSDNTLGTDLVNKVRLFREKSEKEIIPYISGKRMSKIKLKEVFRVLQSTDVTSLAAVSGVNDRKGDSKVVSTFRRHPHHMDSCEIIREASIACSGAYVGATINPFKYTIEDSFLQYFKLVRKLNSGASFIISQAGWDMKKYQELQWFLHSRNLNEPAIARILLLHPDQVNDIIHDKLGGIIMSRPFFELLKQESELSSNQFLTAQVRRLSLQASGCKLMGFSGIQIAGIKSVKILKTIIDGIYEAIERYPTYQLWVKAWNDFHSNVEMAPYPYHYYMFQNLLNQKYPFYDSLNTLKTDGMLPLPNMRTKFNFAVGNGPKLLRSFIAGEKNKDPLWSLSTTKKYTTRRCPKGLSEGPCGGTSPDGNCEFGHQKCIFREILAIAKWQNNLKDFENPQGW